MQFLKNILASCLGVFVALVLIIISVSIIAAAFSSSYEERVNVSDNSILVLKLNEPIRELAAEDPFKNLDLLFPIPVDKRSAIGLKEMKLVIARAAEDDKIKGIYLELTDIYANFTSIEEIRSSLLSFKESGKFIYAYSERLSEGAYYLASVADKIMLHPRGSIEFNGLSATKVYYKGIFEKVGVKPRVFKVGEYKSAAESYTSDHMSEEDRQQIKAYVDALYSSYLEKVSESRNIAFKSLENISDSMLIRNAEDALRCGLITDICYHDSAFSALKDSLHLAEGDDIESIDYNKYKEITASSRKLSKNKIAVVVVEGTITEGESKDSNVGGETVSKLLRKIRKDDKIKAVVLRVNSPGGSELASDKIWREIQLMKKKKPVIASMSGVAASGGYYIAMGCDTIVAAPNTLTGSIGIFAILLETSELFNKKLGITFDGVNTGLLSDFPAYSRPLSEWEEQIIQQSVNEGYENFTKKAAEDRQMNIQTLKAVASGRIWSGTDAKEKGLVDVLGNMKDAIVIAAKKADINDDYQLVYYPEPKDWIEELIRSTNVQAFSWFGIKQQNQVDATIQQFKQLKAIEGKPQARLPYDLIIE